MQYNEHILAGLDIREGCCSYCGRRMNYIKWHKYQFTIDHVIPKSNGGTNCPLNLLPCCRTCNVMKADSSLDYFLTLIGFRISENIWSKCSLKRWMHIEKSIVYIKEQMGKYKKEIFRYCKVKIISEETAATLKQKLAS